MSPQGLLCPDPWTWHVLHQPGSVTSATKHAPSVRLGGAGAPDVGAVPDCPTRGARQLPFFWGLVMGERLPVQRPPLLFIAHSTLAREATA